MDSPPIIKRFIDVTGESVKTEALNADIIANRTVKAVEEAGALMETAGQHLPGDAKTSRRRRPP